MQIDEINRPTPVTAKRATKMESKNRNGFPRNGILKNTIEKMSIKQVNDSEITIAGTVLPMRISFEDKGETRSWSKVPSSRSRATERAVNRSVTTTDNIETRKDNVNHKYSKFGLNQLRLTTLIEAPPAPIETFLASKSVTICEA